MLNEGQLSTKLTNLVLCRVNLVRFPDDGPVRIETCRNIQGDCAVQTSR